MGVDRALCLYPGAAVVEARFDAYAEASRAVFEVFARTAPLVEGLSIDEVFLDVRGMERIAGTSSEIATGLRREVRERLGLPLTVGVAGTKFLTKVASGVAKPDGLLVVPLGEKLLFLQPLPVEHLWGVGPVTARKLHQRGLRTVGAVAAMSEAALIAALGRGLGRHLHALAQNASPTVLNTWPPCPSIASRSSVSCRASAAFIASGWRSQSRVEPSMSGEQERDGSGRQ